METLKAIHTRKSVREFLEADVPVDLIRLVVEAGTHAPSGGNQQPWRFVVCRDKAKQKEFDPYGHQPWVESAPAIIVVCADPHDSWRKDDEFSECYVLDASMAVQNMLLATHDLGLGSVFVQTFSPLKVRTMLGIPLHWRILGLIALGYADPESEANQQTRPRRTISEVAFLEDVEKPL
jgi:nitroreductase